MLTRGVNTPMETPLYTWNGSTAPRDECFRHISLCFALFTFALAVKPHRRFLLTSG